MRMRITLWDLLLRAFGRVREAGPFFSGMLDPVTVAKGKIIRVDTLDPKVDDALRELFPDTGDAL